MFARKDNDIIQFFRYFCIFFSRFLLVRLIVTAYFFSFLAFDTLELESSLVLFLALSLSPSLVLSFFHCALGSETEQKRTGSARARERVMSSTLIRVEKERRRESDFFLLHGIERQRRILPMSYAEKKLLLTMENWQNQLMIKSRFVSYSSITLRCKEG